MFSYLKVFFKENVKVIIAMFYTGLKKTTSNKEEVAEVYCL